jgi:predicted GIY-YIG superfamily endonuclease
MFALKSKQALVVRRFWLYAIALEHNKYYVGITAHKDPYVRLRQHGGPFGARWTLAHKPLKPLQVLRLEKLGAMTLQEAEAHEQAAFEEFRKQYGLRNVRGGRVTSSYAVFRIGSFYFNSAMLESFGVVLLLIACVLIFMLKG